MNAENSTKLETLEEELEQVTSRNTELTEQLEASTQTATRLEEEMTKTIASCEDEVAAHQSVVRENEKIIRQMEDEKKNAEEKMEGEIDSLNMKIADLKVLKGLSEFLNKGYDSGLGSKRDREIEKKMCAKIFQYIYIILYFSFLMF